MVAYLLARPRLGPAPLPANGERGICHGGSIKLHPCHGAGGVIVISARVLCIPCSVEQRADRAMPPDDPSDLLGAGAQLFSPRGLPTFGIGPKHWCFEQMMPWHIACIRTQA